MPGHLHDTSCARELGVTAALNWAETQLDLPTLADSGYESAGHGIKTPVKQPSDGSQLAPDNRAYNRLLRGLRWQGERGFAILIGRWKTLRHTTVSPRRIGEKKSRHQNHASCHYSHWLPSRGVELVIYPGIWQFRILPAACRSGRLPHPIKSIQGKPGAKGTS